MKLLKMNERMREEAGRDRIRSSRHGTTFNTLALEKPRQLESGVPVPYQAHALSLVSGPQDPMFKRAFELHDTNCNNQEMRSTGAGRPLLNMTRFRILVLLLFLCFTQTLAAKESTSYCKCICFQNSTIIPLNSPPSASTTAASLRLRDEDENERDQTHRTLTCNDCNRAFCLDYNLPICKNAKEEDVFAQCFQRDSLKDRLIVTLFILVTVSLLGWALIKPYVIKSAVPDVLDRYAPHSTAGGSDTRGLLRHPETDQDSGRPGTSGSLARQGGLNS